MKIDEIVPPRRYRPGARQPTEIADCARINLAPDEQVTFVTAGRGEYDVTRKDWGFYATPSLNGRLAGFGLRGVLVKNAGARLFVMLVERGHDESFQHYVAAEQLTIVAWLDEGEAALREAFAR